MIIKNSDIDNKLILKGLNNKILKQIFSKKFDIMEKKILGNRLPPLYKLEINKIFSSHNTKKRNSIKYLHFINKTILKDKLKSENIIENNNNLLNDFITEGKYPNPKKSFYEMEKIRIINNLWDYSHEYCERSIGFYSSRFFIINQNCSLAKESSKISGPEQGMESEYEKDNFNQKLFEGHHQKIGAFAVHPKSRNLYFFLNFLLI
jgi:hypothetical protein